MLESRRDALYIPLLTKRFLTIHGLIYLSQVGLLNKGPSLPGMLTAMFAPSGKEDNKVR